MEKYFHIIILKGTYGEVFRAIKQLDQLFYAIKRIYFSVANELNLRDHRIFREIEAL